MWRCDDSGAAVGADGGGGSGVGSNFCSSCVSSNNFVVMDQLKHRAEFLFLQQIKLGRELLRQGQSCSSGRGYWKTLIQ